MKQKIMWLWLSLQFGAGNKIYQKLYDYFGSIEKIFDTDDSDMDSINWLLDFQKRKLLDKNTDYAEEVFEWCDDHNVKILTYSDPDFPEILKSIPECPIVLYYVGKLPKFDDELCISVVGTRKMTVYGQKAAYEMGFGLAKAGAVVVSGMALGIDCTAQKGALYAGGTTVAVLGSGIDVIYPRQNTPVFEKIARTGAVITEYPPHTPPNGSNFPVRNRIISGLSSATVVVEADRNSGSLITAKLAVHQGREIFAVPGPIKTNSCEGTNDLIRDGAKVATSATDIVEQFLDRYSDKVDISASKLRPILPKKEVKVASNMETGNGFYSDYVNKTQNSRENIKNSYQNAEKSGNENKEINNIKSTVDISKLSENERKIYEFMTYDKLYSTDEIDIPELSIADIMSAMTMLEMADAVYETNGGLFAKK